MWKKIALTFLLVLTFTLNSPGLATAAGLKSFVDTQDGYQFLYPNGWIQVKVANGPDVVFHDFIESTENISVDISPVPEAKTLTELGTPTEIGYKLGKNALAPEGSGRTAELVNAEQKDVEGKKYYILEYAVQLPNSQKRHNLASIATSRGKLFTFNASVAERRWGRVKGLIQDSIDSFVVY